MKLTKWMMLTGMLLGMSGCSEPEACALFDVIRYGSQEARDDVFPHKDLDEQIILHNEVYTSVCG